MRRIRLSAFLLIGLASPGHSTAHARKHRAGSCVVTQCVLVQRRLARTEDHWRTLEAATFSRLGCSTIVTVRLSVDYGQLLNIRQYPHFLSTSVDKTLSVTGSHGKH